MNWKTLAAACCISACAALPSALAEEAKPAPAAPAAPEESQFDKTLDQIKHPVQWFTWGADLRVREEYIRNSRGLQSGIDDNINMFRIRPRVWADLGPFFSDDSLGIPNGLDFYVRMTEESRIFAVRPTTGPFNTNNARTFNEIVVDNAYAEWKRIIGLPLSVKIGRQDLTYGRGWLILDGTPLDGSRTIFSDAIKATIHFDAVKTDLDLFAVHNKGRGDRLDPIMIEAARPAPLSEYDTRLLGAYLKSMYFDPMEVNAYYIYKDDDLVLAGGNGALLPIPRGRIVHTLGGLVQGKACKAWDYYLESAYQWGSEGGIPGLTTETDRQAWGLTSDLGYTFQQCPMKPRIHGGYEYLSGDDPGSRTYEGWDPILSRWPQSSELYVYRWQFEGASGIGPAGAWSNMQRFTVGMSANPTPKMTTTLDYNYLLANEHSFTNVVPGTVPFGGGDTRGHLIVAKLLYNFNKHVSGHLWAEYFRAGEFYNSTRDDALFLRWELMFKL